MSTQSEDTHSVTFEASKAAGLRRLTSFAPSMGAHYARYRNFDFGPDHRQNVSCLSPWVRPRLLTEDEVARAALSKHGFQASEIFQQEVCWRTYFKGWLEQRPAVWTAYQQQLLRDLDSLARNSGLRSAYEAAVAGRTGIDGFDHWALELIETGYLHNHARMWFASIWMFTLRLPWTLGADFFLRHLMDGDPASNTLSWRWVGGLHTQGKTYLATRSNIEKFTEGRFSPDGLSDNALQIEGLSNPKAGQVPAVARPEKQKSLLLLTEDDLGFESLVPEGVEIVGVCGVSMADARSPLPCGERVITFVDQCVEDALRRSEAFFGAGSMRLNPQTAAQDLIDLARGAGIDQIVTGFCPTGWTREMLHKWKADLAVHSVRMIECQRAWDRLFWPHAEKGFFPLKKRIPGVYETLGLI